MACGLPVVDLYAENNLHDYSEKSCILSNPDSVDIAASIYHLLNNAIALKKMPTAAKELMINKDEEYESRQFEYALSKIFLNSDYPLPDLTPSYGSDAFTYDKNTHPPIPSNYKQLSLETGALSKIHPILAKIIRNFYRFLS